MAFDALTEAETAAGKPVTQPFLRKIKDNFDHLYGTTGSASSGGVPNGSFEIDSDVNGVPDQWDASAYSGGSVAIDATNAVHGLNCIKMVHPGGAGNGGGTLRSDYIECSAFVRTTIGFIHWATAAGMKNQVLAHYYDKDHVELGSGSPATIYSSTANPTSATAFSYREMPPSGAKYIKIKLVGGYTDTNVAGTAYFDDIWIAQTINIKPATQAEQEAGSSEVPFVAPATQHHHPSAAKCFIKCDTAGNINASYNVASIVDSGTGFVTVNIANDFSSGDYVLIPTLQHNSTSSVRVVTAVVAAGYFEMKCYDASDNPVDPANCYMAVVFGDQ